MILIEHPNIGTSTLRQVGVKGKEFVAFEDRRATYKLNCQAKILCIFV